MVSFVENDLVLEEIFFMSNSPYLIRLFVIKSIEKRN